MEREDEEGDGAGGGGTDAMGGKERALNVVALLEADLFYFVFPEILRIHTVEFQVPDEEAYIMLSG
ncbi:hypothetical protein X777_09488 [Ooceraea biroi]|uniref:Uncharacterized protein n=1 Tax=Ooceraea biroi TaxID=2015173 RepID=A0A026W6J5_OOCBI|nr:hypothetical protein X777_09488 [Ooceraea biroi]